jgi:hypothetical protein
MTETFRGVCEKCGDLISTIDGALIREGEAVSHIKCLLSSSEPDKVTDIVHDALMDLERDHFKHN